MKFLIIVVTLTVISSYAVLAAPSSPSPLDDQNPDLLRVLNDLLNDQERTNLANVIATLTGNLDDENSRGLLNVLNTLLRGSANGNSGALDLLRRLLSADSNNENILTQLVNVLVNNRSESGTSSPGSAGLLDLVQSVVGDSGTSTGNKNGDGLTNLLNPRG